MASDIHLMAIFVSYYPGDSDEGLALVAALRASGCDVAHSPDPDAMNGWYASGLSAALDQSRVFVCVVSPAWDSSTWMAIEAEEALRRFNAGRLDGYFCHNPDDRVVRAAGMVPYVRNLLPRGLTETVKVLLGSLSPGEPESP